MAGFARVNLDELEDMAPKFHMDSTQEARFATKPLGCEQTGLSWLRIKPGQRIPFEHRHERQEELYVVVMGSGTAILDDEPVELHAHDALRVSPETVRTFEAADEGMDLLAFGAPAVSGGTNDAVMLE